MKEENIALELLDFIYSICDDKSEVRGGDETIKGDNAIETTFKVNGKSYSIYIQNN
jgi:hypothetical protein